MCYEFLQEDVTIEIPPANDNTKQHAALVWSLDVVCGPREIVRDGGIDAHGAEEGACVSGLVSQQAVCSGLERGFSLHVRVLACEEDDEASYRGADDDHIADSSLASAVCYVANDDGHDGSLRKSVFVKDCRRIACGYQGIRRNAL